MKCLLVTGEWCYWMLVVIKLFTNVVNGQNEQPTDGTTKCTKPVPIQIPECQSTFYNFTGMPNFAGQNSQLEARRELRTFGPLVAYKCSSKLSFFLCSVYTPMCDVETHHLIGPCRPLCELVRNKCSPVLRVFNIDWPASLNCSRFPIQNVVGGTMCMEGPRETELSPKGSDLSSLDNFLELGTSPHKQLFQPTEEFLNEWIHNFIQSNSDGTGTDEIQSSSSISILSRSLRYCAHMKKPTSYVHINRTGRCAPLCQSDILFNQESKYLATIWTAVLTTICGILTIVTLIGYLLDPAQFRPVERPIIYITLCQLLHAFGFVLSLSLGRTAITCGKDLDSGLKIRLQEGLDNSVCALTFLIQYFSALASVFWWALLAIHWAMQHAQCWICTLCLDELIPSQGHPYNSKFGKWWGYMGSICACIPDIQTDGRVLSVSKQNRIPSSLVIMQKRDSSQGEQWRMSTEFGTQPTASYYVQNGKIIPSYSGWSNWMSEQSGRYSTTSKNRTDRIAVCLAREHILVWLTASLLTAGVLVSRQVDADELIPICGVGRQNTRVMGAFVIGPEFTLTLIGFLALLSGSILAILRKRRKRIQQHLLQVITNMNDNNLMNKSKKPIIANANPTSSHFNEFRESLTPSSSYSNKYSAVSDRTSTSTDFLATRLGLFCFISFLPVICLCLCDLYEYLNRDKWLRTEKHQSIGDLLHSLSPNLWKSDEVVGPNPEVFLLRLFMSIAPTFACSLWVWSVKGCGIWQKGLARMAAGIRKFKPNNKHGKISTEKCLFDFPTNVHHGNVFKDSNSYSSNNNKCRQDVSHPYAIYHQQHAVDHRLNTVIVSTSPLDPPLIDLCFVQTISGTVETHHSNATTPGYYSQAKLGSGIEPSLSDTFSEESPIPPPLPASTRPQLPLRGDPCVGASTPHASILAAPPNTLTHGAKPFGVFHVD